MKTFHLILAFSFLASTPASAGDEWKRYQLCLLENFDRALLENPETEPTRFGIGSVMYSIAPYCRRERQKAAYEVVIENLGANAVATTDMDAVERDMETAIISELITDLIEG